MNIFGLEKLDKLIGNSLNHLILMILLELLLIDQLLDLLLMIQIILDQETGIIVYIIELKV